MLYFMLLSLFVSTSFDEERAVFSGIDYSYFCCFSLKEFLFLWMLWKGCVVLLWHSMGLSYNYFDISNLK